MQEQVDSLLSRMRGDLDELTARGDPRRFFHGTYLRTTEAVVAEIDHGGFIDAAWLREWDLAFADLYVAALEADLHGSPVAKPWRIAFDTARTRPDLPPLRHVLLGINAHINYDLPQALLAVMSPADFDDPEVVRRRAADHRHLDNVLSSRVSAEDAELSAVSPMTLLDRVLRPINRIATRRLLAEAREKVWRNTVAMDRARRDGHGCYSAARTDLERLSGARVSDLTAPGPVLLKLALRGFGVLLPGA